jgi:hypothetical protein
LAWEYEILFDVDDMDGMERLTPLEREARLADPDRWKQESSGIRKGSMGYRTRTIKAGPRLEAEIFPLFGREAETRARDAKKRITPEKIQKYNDEKARRNLIRLMDANFGAGDLHITLTYEGEQPEWQRAEKDVKNFIGRLRRYRQKMGLPALKYIYALEDRAEDREKRTHCHFVTTGDMDRVEVERIWKEGTGKRKGSGAGFANCDTLQPTREGLEALARYIYDQNKGAPREKGRKKYVPSKNLTKPKTRTSDTKVSKGRVKKLSHVFATDESEARRIMESLYPGYEFVRGTAKGSDIITDGVYIRVLMRKKGG